MTSIAVTYWLPKTSALLFDHVIGIGPDRCPPSLLPDPPILGVISEDPIHMEFTIDGTEIEASVEGENTYHGLDADAAFRTTTQPLLRTVVEDLRDAGHPAYPVYHSQAAHDGEYQPGDYRVLVSAFEGLAIVDEATLTWEQVLAFRRDKDAKKSYNRFLHWLDQTLLGKDARFVHDELEQRLDDYQEAMRRHGIKTVLGTAAEILDPKIFAAAAAGGAALASVNPLLALGAGSGLVLGNAVLKVTQHLVNFQEQRANLRKEIGYVLEVRAGLRRHGPLAL